MQYVVGYINRDGLPAVQLQELSKNGKPKGDPLEDDALAVNGVLTTDAHGRVILQVEEQPAPSTGGQA